MRKHVAFFEKRYNMESPTQNDRHHLTTARSTGFFHLTPGKYTASGCMHSKHDNGLKKQRVLPPPQGSERQHIQTIHIPTALAAAPFLQHSGLTPGQKRYLCSIAKIYSTDHIRKVMQQHYLNVLHRCIETGPNCFSEIRNEKHRVDSARTADSETLSETNHSGEGNIAAVNFGRIILPKISNKQIRKALSTTASNERKSRKRRTKVSMAQSRSVRGRKRQTNLTQRQEKTGMEILHENISSLSIKEKEVSKT